ncbi:MAG: type II secretion system F family protein [Candidatus Sungbacteria bacterium]|uniref:Type II secretion system F family protein n=1 Tax=Candidatus Sungiibacteriota bacterium TaxID=2750080 RepID=A0A931YDF0_9BACT|nr:type II secretion system F family protein [Candidatus Sungbacteria bacterium]
MEYEFKAVSKDGQKVSGARESASQVALARELRDEGLFLVGASERSLTVKTNAGHDPSFFKNLSASFDFLIKHVSLQEKVVFSRHLGLMIKAGFSLNKALETLARQTANKYFAGVLKDLNDKVAAGKSFYDAASEHKNVFSPVFISMIQVGEASGKLEETLKLATLHLKREYGLKRKIKGALAYPAVVVGAMAAVGTLMMVFVLPQLAATFSELNIELPLSTKIIFGLSDFIINFWYLALALAAVVVYGFYFFSKRTELGRKSVDFIFLKFPIFSDLTRKLNSARLARTLSSLLSGGVPLPEALRITSDTLNNFFYRRAVSAAIPEVEKGQTLSSVLLRYPHLFPPVVTEMTAVGEETGSLVVILKELARFFENEVSIATKSLSSIVEPIIMIAIGVAVGIFALSIIQPIYSIGTGL